MLRPAIAPLDVILDVCSNVSTLPSPGECRTKMFFRANKKYVAGMFLVFPWKSKRTLHRTVSCGDVIFNKTGVKNLMTVASSWSSVSAVPNRNRTRSISSVIQMDFCMLSLLVDWFEKKCCFFLYRFHCPSPTFLLVKNANCSITHSFDEWNGYYR